MLVFLKFLNIKLYLVFTKTFAIIIAKFEIKWLYCEGLNYQV